MKKEAQVQFSDVCSCEMCGCLMHKEDAVTNKIIKEQEEHRQNFFSKMVEKYYLKNLGFSDGTSGLSSEEVKCEDGSYIVVHYYCGRCWRELKRKEEEEKKPKKKRRKRKTKKRRRS